MAADGIVRLSKIEVYPEYLDEYKGKIRDDEVGEVPCAPNQKLTMYAVSERESLYGNDSRKP